MHQAEASSSDPGASAMATETDTNAPSSNRLQVFHGSSYMTVVTLHSTPAPAKAARAKGLGAKNPAKPNTPWMDKDGIIC